MIKLDFDPDAATVDNPVPLVQRRDALWPDVSPDGEWVVFFEGLGQQEDIGIVRVDGTAYRKLTDDPIVDRHPRWSPDGQRIAFGSRRTGKWEVWSIHRDGSGLERLTTSHGPDERGLYPVWSPDGAFLAYQRGRGLGSVIMSVEDNTSGGLLPVLPSLEEEGAEFIAWSWSSDGKELAGWRRDRSTGRDRGIIVYSFDSEAFESLTDFGRNPVWLGDNRRLLFHDESREKMFLVDRSTKQVRELVSGSAIRGEHLAISPDDRHIYAATRVLEADIWLLTLNEKR